LRHFDVVVLPIKKDMKHVSILIIVPAVHADMGDEDGGAMSSWYVFSALGFYPVTPGVDQYAIGSPLFEKATIKLENGKEFIIEAENNSPENIYIQSATLNGKSYSHNWTNHENIVNGGTLNLVMGQQPNYERGTKIEDRPFSASPGK
jgi:putative alpha-1,2-mannosidase